MVSELSILIPVYNQSVLSLLEALLAQVPALPIPVEIRVYDDGSSPEHLLLNREATLMPGVIYKELPTNLGRSKIRFLLAQEAAYDWLLFLDNDVIPVGNYFLQSYVSQATQSVAVGGVSYQEHFPPQAKLRWVYGKNREQASVSTRQKQPYHRVFFSNLLVRKDILLSCFSFTDIRGYGHEDSLFAHRLQESNLAVQHLDNPVYHLGLEDATTFLAKTEEGVRNLVLLQKTVPLAQESKLMQVYLRLHRYKIDKLLSIPVGIFLPQLRRNLLSKKPNLVFFDLYKLMLYITYKSKN